MPKYWGKHIFTHGRFPKMGQKQDGEKREKDWKKEGHSSTHGARKLPGPILVAKQNWILLYLLDLKFHAIVPSHPYGGSNHDDYQARLGLGYSCERRRTRWQKVTYIWPDKDEDKPTPPSCCYFPYAPQSNPTVGWKLSWSPWGNTCLPRAG